MYIPRLTLWTGLLLAAMGGGAAAWLLLLPLPAQPSDVIAFAGSIIGAGMTVLGALVIVDYQLHQGARKRRDLLVSLLEDVLARAADLRESKASDLLPRQFVLHGNTQQMNEAMDRAKSAVHWVVPDDAATAYALGQIAQLQFDPAKFREALTPTLFYGGDIDFDPHLLMLETRVKAALHVLKKG